MINWDIFIEAIVTLAIFIIFPESRVPIILIIASAFLILLIVPTYNFINFIWRKIFNSKLTLREQILKRSDYKCEKCGSPVHLHVHHIIPKKIGGKDVLENLQVLCRECHEKIHGYEIGGDATKKTGKSKKIKVLLEAIETNQDIEISYVKADGEKISRIIKPLDLYIKHQRQYMTAYDYFRKDKRTFRILRIQRISQKSNTCFRE